MAGGGNRRLDSDPAAAGGVFRPRADAGSGDPTSVTEDKYRIISARYFGVFAYGAVWLAGVIFLNPWFLKARNAAQLLLRFGIVIAGEALVWGLGVLVQELVMS